MRATLEATTNCGDGSNTVQLAALKRGDSIAGEWLFERLLPQVLELARHRIGHCPARSHDEFELAFEVLSMLLMRARSFDQLSTRSELARILDRLVKYKSVDAYRRMRKRQRIGMGQAWMAGFTTHAHGGRRFRTEELSSDAIQIIAIELLESLLQTIRKLNANELQCDQILKLIVEGYSVAEVSQIVGRGERSIYRLLARSEGEFCKSLDSAL